MVACPECGEVFDSTGGSAAGPESPARETEQDIIIQTFGQGGPRQEGPRVWRFPGGDGQNGPFVFRYERMGDPGCNQACGCGCFLILVIFALAVQGVFSLF
jgi:hypothetical protein